MVAADDSKYVTVENNVITITAPLGSPVQINLNPWSDLPTVFTLGAPCNLKGADGVSTADYSILLVDRAGALTGTGGLQWTYNKVAYAISVIPTNGAAVIDLNDASGANQKFSYDIMLMDSAGNWGMFDPEITNDPVEE